MKIIACAFYYFFIGFFRIIPFKLAYLFSDFLAFLFFKILKYRVKVVYEGMKNSFPEMSDEEMNKHVKDVYKNIADIFVEVIKTGSLSKKEVHKRFKIENSEILEELAQTGENIMLTGGHINNWEWSLHAIQLLTPFEHRSLYQPMTNKCVEKHITTKIRQKFGGKMYPLSQTRAMFEEQANSVLYILGADQSPSSTKFGLWVDFLNQPTLFLHGPEKYQKEYNLTVVHVHIKRTGRGYYTLEFKTLAKKEENLKPNELTLRYVRELQKEILSAPGSWLWTHKRWKKKPSADANILSIPK